MGGNATVNHRDHLIATYTVVTVITVIHGGIATFTVV